jgi:hypothetical protein
MTTGIGFVKIFQFIVHASDDKAIVFVFSALSEPPHSGHINSCLQAC